MFMYDLSLLRSMSRLFGKLLKYKKVVRFVEKGEFYFFLNMARIGWIYFSFVQGSYCYNKCEAGYETMTIK